MRRPWRRVSQGKFPGKKIFEKHKGGWTGWSIMGEAENAWNEIRDGAIMQVLRGHGREVFSCYGKPEENLSEGLVWFTFSDPPDCWVEVVTVGTGEGKDSERWGVGTHGADQFRHGSVRKRGKTQSSFFVLIKAKWKGGGFRWSSQASVLDSVAMAGDTCLGNITEQA